MQPKLITLTQEEWDRLVDILNDYVSHPDISYLLSRITEQLYFSSADEKPQTPIRHVSQNALSQKTA